MQSMRINDDAVREALGPYATTTTLKTFSQIESTNQWLCDHPPATTSVVLAATQTAGRGRRGRKWQSPAGGIYFSVGQRITETRFTPPALSLLIGITLADALTTMGAANVLVKWPNDLVVSGQKLAGILVEQTSTVLVVGVGLNWQSETLAANLPEDRQAIGLCECLSAEFLPSKEAVCGALAKRVLDTLTLPAAQFESFLGIHWSRWDALANKMITIERSDDTLIEGQGAGVTEQGALRLLTREGTVEIHSGEARVRGGWEHAY